MSTKTKILIGILAFIILVGGWWILKNQPSESVSSEKIYKKGEPVELWWTEKEELTDRKEECTKSEDPSSCYLSLAKELRDPFICEEIRTSNSKRFGSTSNHLLRKGFRILYFFKRSSIMQEIP